MTERQVFETAMQISDLAAREVWIDQACGADAVLRDRVQALLAEHAADSQFANSPVANQSEEPFDSRITGQTSLFPAGGPHGAEAPGANADQDADDNDDETTPDLSFLSPSASPGSIGKLGHYEILQVLGQGAFGIVFKAFDEKLHRLVAIKVINPQLAATSPPRKRFLREARSAAAIKHDNIVQVYSVEEQPLPYLVMEYVDGPTLQQKLDGSGPLELPEILHLGRQMASGLAAAHAQGLIHRDIKPGNILLERGAEQRVKITDFGLARAADDASMTSTGIISGTPMYMAPEQAMGQVLDHRADLFSLGSVLYQMASGRPPFRGPTAIAVLKRVADEAPRPIPDIISDVPVWLCEIIEKLHAKKPEDRFQTAKEVADLLSRSQTHPPTSEELAATRRASGVSRMVEPVAASQENKPPEQVQQTQVISNPKSARTSSPWRWLVPFGVISIAILGFLISQIDQSPKSSETEPAVVQSELPDLKSQTPEKTGWQGWPADAPRPALAPFDAAQAKKLQEEWAAYLKIPVEYENSIGMKFVLIPPGEFTMGSTAEEIAAALKDVGKDKHWQEPIQSEAPQHKVILTQPIYLGVNEVTQAEYEQVLGKNPSYYAATGSEKAWVERVAGMDTTRHPVEGVSWNDAAEFCAKLSKQEKLKPFYFRAGETITPLDGTGYHLPSEAEWEFACRAGTATKYWISDQDDDLVRAGWFVGNSGVRTHAAGELKANPFGLADIHGNVWEWVHDGWDATYYGQFEEKPAINPISPFSAGSLRVVRGGSWDHTASTCRSSNRHALDPPFRDSHIGFRVSLEVDAVRQVFKVTGPALPKPVATTQSTPASAKAGWHGWPADAPLPAIAPFDATQAKQHQKAWADYLKVPVEYTNSIGMKFRLIPPGEFMMGSTKEEIQAALSDLSMQGETFKHYDVWRSWINSEAPHHQVVLTQPIYIGAHEVTQLEYEKVMRDGQNDSSFVRMKQVGEVDVNNRPVGEISWNDAAEFCTKLSQLEKLNPFYSQSGEVTSILNGTGYRLPSEAEWEFACRSGMTTRFWNGENAEDLIQAGWFDQNSGGRSHAVGELKANPFGLRDVHGNVYEWVQDWWEPEYSVPKRGTPAINPTGPISDRSERVFRGGGWSDWTSNCRASMRYAKSPTTRHHDYGFRVSLGLDALRPGLKVTDSAIPKPVVNTPSDPAHAAIDFAAERKAAEWVLSTGGLVTLHDVDDKPLPLVDGKLPEVRFTLVTAYLGRGPGFADKGLANLRPCGNLITLSLHMHSRVSDAGIAQLENARIKQLAVDGCPLVTDKAIRSIAKIQDLNALVLGCTGFSDAGLIELEPLKQLEVVHVEDSSITDQGLVRLAEACPQLTHLSIINGQDEKRSVRAFERFRNLGTVYISGHQLTDDAVSVLNAHPTISALYVNSPLNDQTIQRLKGLQRTSGIEIRSARNEAAAKISETTYSDAVWPECLTALQFGGVNASPRDRDLIHFAKLPKLKVLALLDGGPQPNYTAAGIAKFRELRPDVRLFVDENEYPATKVAVVPTAPGIDFAAERKVAERLLRLGKGSANLGNKDRQFIGHLKEPLPSEPFCILALDFSGEDLSDDELAAASGCREIEKLIFNGNHKITTAGLKHLGILPHLKELLIDSTQVGDDVIEWLANTSSLNRLQATNTPISAAGWTRLPSCSRLRHLDTSFHVDDAGLRRIVERCPELRELYCLSRSIQDLTPLLGLVRLRSLHLSAELLTDAAIDTLLKLPVLDELFVDYPDEPGLMRIKRMRPKLTRLTFRDSRDGSSLASSEKWTAVTEMRGLLELTISGKIPVDGEGLRRIATMPNLQRLHISADLDAEQTAKFRTFTSDDVLTFRKTRPDVELSISWQKFPALADWPGKFEGSPSIQAWPAARTDSPEPAIGNFSPEIAKQHQANWAKHLKVPEEFTNSIGMKFRLIPPGEIEVDIGTPAEPKLALKRITSSYYMGTTEVTVGQFKKFVKATGYKTDAERTKNADNLQFQTDPSANWKTPGYVTTDDLPVNIISASDAVAFCDWLNTLPPGNDNSKSDLTTGNQPSGSYRLPKELEWEIACRAGGATDFGFAGTAKELLNFAWTTENVAGLPTPVQSVATKRENPFGLHDVLGNVWEWYTTDAGTVYGVKGGAYADGATQTTIARRSPCAHWLRPNVGFRILRQVQSSPRPSFAKDPVLVALNQPLGPQVNVVRPMPIPGIRSWTVELSGHRSSKIRWSPAGNVIATTGNDMSIRLWDRDGRLKSILLGHAGTPTDISFSPDGQRLATLDMVADEFATGSTLRIWGVGSGSCKAIVPLSSWGFCVVWSPDGMHIAYAGTRGMCEVLNLNTGQSRHQ